MSLKRFTTKSRYDLKKRTQRSSGFSPSYGHFEFFPIGAYIPKISIFHTTTMALSKRSETLQKHFSIGKKRCCKVSEGFSSSWLSIGIIEFLTIGISRPKNLDFSDQHHGVVETL